MKIGKVTDLQCHQMEHHLVAADVIVLATSVYFYAMNGQLKALIDRTLPRRPLYRSGPGHRLQWGDWIPAYDEFLTDVFQNN